MKLLILCLLLTGCATTQPHHQYTKQEAMLDAKREGTFDEILWELPEDARFLDPIYFQYWENQYY